MITVKEGDSYSFGREGTNDCQIHDIRVSRRHCRLILERGSPCVVLYDTSQSGTFVGNDLVRQNLKELAWGDTVKLLQDGGPCPKKKIRDQVCTQSLIAFPLQTYSLYVDA